MENHELQLGDEKSLMKFLQEPSIKIAEAITGILASEQKDWKLSAGKLIQASIKGTLLTQLGRELKKYREEGKIKEDYFAMSKTRAILYELLKFLDEEVPDEDLFRAMKSIFFTGISVNTTEYDQALAYEFLQTAKKLSGTEILILKANSEFALGNFSDKISKESTALSQSNRSTWRRNISIQMGYGELHSIVAKYENNLESLGLISARNDDTRFQNDFEPTGMYRLTQVGNKFTEFIANYPNLN